MNDKILCVLLIVIGFLEIVPNPHYRIFDIMGGLFIGFGACWLIRNIKTKRTGGKK